MDKKYIIGFLCLVCILMFSTYAAFNSQLKISGTSTITGNFVVKITSITPKNIVGNASDKSEVTTHTDTTATFGVNLVAPGDSITYDIVIENQGNIDAILKNITKTSSDNLAILFEVSGVLKNDQLLAGESTTMTVKVSYNESISEQEEKLTSTLNLSLDYVELDKNNPSFEENMAEQIIALSEEKSDQVFIDDYGNARYYGKNPDNYVTFNDESWRVVGVFNNKVKLIKETSIGDYEWNSSKTSGKNYNDWESSTLNTYLNNDYYYSLSDEARSFITSSTWYLGGTNSSNRKTLVPSKWYLAERSSDVRSGNATQIISNIAIMYPSDYGYATSGGSTASKETCLNKALYDWDEKKVSDCKDNDWLFLGEDEWTISHYVSDELYAALINSSGYVRGINHFVNIDNLAVRPVLFLRADTKISSGEGTVKSPFQLSVD